MNHTGSGVRVLSKIVPAVGDGAPGTPRSGTGRRPAASHPAVRSPGTRTRPASAATLGPLE